MIPWPNNNALRQMSGTHHSLRFGHPLMRLIGDLGG